MVTIDIESGEFPVESFFEALRRATQNSLDVLLEEVTLYPPPRPGSDYKRGGPGSQNLGQQWSVEVEALGEEVTGLIGNNVSYGPFVQSEGRQAWMHRGRWNTVDAIARDQLSLIERIFEVELNNALGN